MENIEQEIWNDFKSLGESSLYDRLSYNCANAHFGVAYEDRTSLIHNGMSRKLLYDEDFKINQFLLASDYKNVNWGELQKLYPNHVPIVLPKSITYPPPKFRTKQENKNIECILLNDWEEKKNKLHIKIPNEKSAIDYLISIRWDDTIRCSKCDSKRIYKYGDSRYGCSHCRTLFSEKVGTIFQNTKSNLLTWYEAMYLLTGLKTSKISQPQLAKAIGVTQKTSFMMVHKIQSKVSDGFLLKLKQGLFSNQYAV